MKKAYLLSIVPILFYSTIIYSQKIDSSEKDNIRYFKANLVPAITQAPTETSRIVDLSNHLVIHLSNDSLSVTIKNKILPISNIRQLDQYLTKNTEIRKQSNIDIRSNSDTKYERFKELVDVLKRNKIYDFSFGPISK